MPEINAFNGGLSKKVAPHFVQAHEAVELINADVSNGVLQSMRAKSFLVPNVLSNFYNFNNLIVSSNDDRSYVEYNENLYFSDGKQAQWTEDGETFFPLGFSGATDIPETEILEIAYTFNVTTGGTLPPELLEYRIINETDDIVSVHEYDNINEGNKATFSFTEVKDYSVYRKIEGDFLFVGSVTGPGDVEDGAEIIGTTGEVTEFLTVPIASDQAIGSTAILGDKLYILKILKPKYFTTIESGDYSGVFELVEYDLMTETYKTYAGPIGSSANTSSMLARDLRGLVIINNELYIHFGVPESNYMLYYIKFTGTGWASQIKLTIPDAMWKEHSSKIPVTYGTLLFYIVEKSGYAITFDGTIFGQVTLGKMVEYDHPIDASIVDDVVFLSVYNESTEPLGLHTYKCAFGDSTWEEVTTAFLNDSPAYFHKSLPYPAKYGVRHVGQGSTMTAIDSTVPIVGLESVSLYNTILDNSQKSTLEPLFDPFNEYVFRTTKDENIYLSSDQPKDESTINHVMYQITLSSGFTQDIGDPMYYDTLDGSYTYKITYCDSDGGNETAPSEPSSVLEVEKSSTKITMPTYGGSQTHMRIYRQGGAVTKYRLVEQVVSGTTEYIDNVADYELTELLTTEGTFAAPENIKFLTEHGGRLWGAAGDDYTLLFYSDIGDPTEWAPLQYIKISNSITGLGSTGLGLVVFTKRTTEIILGYDGSTFQKRLVSKSKGCLSHKSIQSKDGDLIFVSHLGICITNGSNVQLISEPKLGVTSWFPKFSILHNDHYYVGTNAFIMILNLLNGLIFFMRDIEDIKGFGTIDGELCVSNGSDAYVLFGQDENLYFKYKSGDLTEGAISNLKEFDEIRVFSSGQIDMKIYINDILVVSQTLSEGLTRVGIPNKQNKGNKIAFSLEGIGSVYSIEYTLKGRSNE